ncbi:MAG TPA: 3-(methylthio)propionyl-CoA ligase [Stellaceae bacterium]
MRGLMMDRPLLISGLIQYAAEYHGDTEIVTRTVEGPIHRYNYAESEARAKQIANALTRLGIKLGDRVATLAWNTHRHFELYYGISGIGAVLHTLNPRLFSEQLVYMVNHAEDQVLCVDLTFVPLAEKLAAQWPTVRHYIVMTDAEHMPQTSLPNALCYETLVAAERPELTWPLVDENTASSLCYTSGTTGNPKGSLYSHRSTVLHSMAACSANAIAFSAEDSVLPIVPMFHANAWGAPYSAAYAGSKLVFPGPKLDGASVCELMEAEGVTAGLGVPTVWLGCLNYLEQTGKTLGKLQRVLCGGSAVPLAMIATFDERYGVEFLQGWGMTEMSPLGTVSRPKGKHRDLDAAARHAIRARQGVPVCLVECKIVGFDGKIAPHDGETRGELLVRGPWIINGYYNDPAATEAAFDAEGWFKTGDVAVIDTDGYVQIVDRSKDVIKSGGEWISSIDVENAMMGHPDVAEAAVIGLPHPKWDERPLLIVVRKEGRDPQGADLLRFLTDKLAKWQLPDDVVFVPEIPHGGTGKILKTRLREMFKEHRLPTA